MIPTISASRLKVFKTCQRQFYYKYILPHNDRPADDKNIGALLGTSLHKAIESYYKDGQKPTVIFQECMSTTLDQWEQDGLKINAVDYYPRAMKVGKDILNTFDWKKFNPRELELEFTLPFPDAQNPIVYINGLIDMITVEGDVIDHKSASQLPTQDEIDHDVQFILYRWAYEQLYGKPPRSVIWNHLRLATLIEVNVEKDYAYKFAQLILDIQALVAAHTFPRINLTPSICKKKCSFYDLCYGGF